MEAIILAGGKGTRLRTVVKDIPKPMADIAGRPFLEYLIDYLISQGTKRIVISTGYLSEVILNYFGNEYENVPLIYARENIALGTGGAIKNALEYTESNEIFVINGDTFFPIELHKIVALHQSSGAILSMAMCRIDSDGRYGGVRTNKQSKIIGFVDKGQIGKIDINAGIYYLDKKRFLSIMPSRNIFSIEEEFLKIFPERNPFYGFICHNYFIDIGIPEDYSKAIIDLPKIQFERKHPVLYIDRDGVINTKIEDGYVTTWDKFEFIDGVLETLKEMSTHFEKIIIVTNQRGVSRGLMTEGDLSNIHQKMIKEITKSGGRIDKIYYCLCGDEPDCYCRKPKRGMIDEAIKDFPEIENLKSFFIGDSESDMSLGREIGSHNIFIRRGKSEIDNETIANLDDVYDSLHDFWINLRENSKISS